jgi:hypothetical protein
MFYPVFAGFILRFYGLLTPLCPVGTVVEPNQT